MKERNAVLMVGLAAVLVIGASLFARQAGWVYRDIINIGGSTANCSRVNSSLQTKDTIDILTNAGKYSAFVAKIWIDAPTDSVLRTSDAGMDSASIAWRFKFDETNSTYDSTRIVSIPCSTLARINLLDSLGQKSRLLGDIFQVIITCVDTCDVPANLLADSSYTYPVRISVYGVE